MVRLRIDLARLEKELLDARYVLADWERVWGKPRGGLGWSARVRREPYLRQIVWLEPRVKAARERVPTVMGVAWYYLELAEAAVSPLERETARRAMAKASMALGGMNPLPQVRWFELTDDAERFGTWPHKAFLLDEHLDGLAEPDGETIWLRTGRPLGSLIETTFHEVSHVQQYRKSGRAYTPKVRELYEAQAETFALALASQLE
jgi:hypothetical protein